MLTTFLLAYSLFLSPVSSLVSNHFDKHTAAGDYTLVIEGFDWGPAVNKVILSLGDTASRVNAQDFVVEAARSSKDIPINEAWASGQRKVVHAYVSNEKGAIQSNGRFITLVLFVSPNLPLGSPIQYAPRKGNQWIDYKLRITNKKMNREWDTEAGRIMPLIDQFDPSGKFTHGNLTLTYASYKPKTNKTKSPLIIWLHGGGEGGTDPRIALVANRAANYASEDIQVYFNGAYVLVPQCPTFWMQNAEGGYTRGQVDDVNNQALMALIKDFVKKNPGIDADRIYVGGCSNGGYMSLKLILMYPDFFAAGYISALAYESEFITDAQIKSITKVPIWFVQSKDDPVTLADKTAIPVYKRLMAAGAKNVHFSLYDHVVDITGFYGGDNFHYNGHWSWIYSHANKCMMDFDGKPVTMKGKPVTIMEWMAAQKR